jgi:hypothetical protein
VNPSRMCDSRKYAHARPFPSVWPPVIIIALCQRRERRFLSDCRAIAPHFLAFFLFSHHRGCMLLKRAMTLVDRRGKDFRRFALPIDLLRCPRPMFLRLLTLGPNVPQQQATNRSGQLGKPGTNASASELS